MKNVEILIIAAAISVGACSKSAEPIPDNVAMMQDGITNQVLADGSLAATSSDQVPLDALQQAFKTAFPKTNEAGQDGEFIPVKLFWLPWGPVLVSKSDDTGAPQWQKVAIHYLHFKNGLFTVTKSFLDSGSGGLNPTLSKKFSRFPVIYSEGGIVGGGVTQSFFELTELRPDGPHVLGKFIDGEDNGDGVSSETAKFGAISKSGFDLICPPHFGDKTIHYRRLKESFVTNSDDEEGGCATD